MNELRDFQRKVHADEQNKYNDERMKETDIVKNSMALYYNRRAQTEAALREQWKSRDKALWERVEQAIKEEEDKYRAMQEAEQKRREEEERKRKEEEERIRKEEEQKAALEAEEMKKALEDQLKKEMEELEREEREKALKLKKAQNEATLKLREATGLFEADDMWKMGLRALRVSCEYSLAPNYGHLSSFTVYKECNNACRQGSKTTRSEARELSSSPSSPFKKAMECTTT